MPSDEAPDTYPLKASHRAWFQDIDHTRLDLTDEAKQYVGAGSPEAQVFEAVPEEGLPLPELKVCHWLDLIRVMKAAAIHAAPMLIGWPVPIWHQLCTMPTPRHQLGAAQP